MRKLLLHYLQGRLLALMEIIDPPEKLDPESIHVLRVELKRVRFLAWVIKKYIPGVKLKKAYKPFKVLFEAAGELRGEHVNLYRKSQSERGESETRINDINRKTRKLELRFTDLLTLQGKKIKKGMERLAGKLDKFPAISQEKFVDNLSAQVLKNLTPRTPEKELHRNRHRLKGILYAAEIGPRISTLVKKRFSLDHILKLEDAIGDWHDLTILLHRARKTGVLSTEGIKTARKKRKEKLRFIYESITRLHAN